MTAAGDQVLAVAYGEVGTTEQPPNSNNVKYWDPWGANYGAWCAAFVSWCMAQAGYPLPAINGPPGFSYCPSGQEWGYTYDGSNVDLQPGDVLIFSWEPWHMEGGIAVCSSGAYAGAPAGDHTGFWAGNGLTVEGNTSQSSWDNGGAVMERADRYGGQICCTWRPAAIAGGAGPEEEDLTPEQASQLDFVFHVLADTDRFLNMAGMLQQSTPQVDTVYHHVVDADRLLNIGTNVTDMTPKVDATFHHVTDSNRLLDIGTNTNQLVADHREQDAQLDRIESEVTPEK